MEDREARRAMPAAVVGGGGAPDRVAHLRRLRHRSRRPRLMVPVASGLAVPVASRVPSGVPGDVSPGVPSGVPSGLAGRAVDAVLHGDVGPSDLGGLRRVISSCMQQTYEKNQLTLGACVDANEHQAPCMEKERNIPRSLLPSARTHEPRTASTRRTVVRKTRRHGFLGWSMVRRLPGACRIARIISVYRRVFDLI